MEKIEAASETEEVTRDNFATFVRDILGMRIVCLRLSDVARVEDFIASLRDEDKVRFVEGPIRKKTFVLRVDPHEEAGEELDLQYSGYSSTHYVLELGLGTGVPQTLLALRLELQVRTILEEAWGEIDHKYRYELTRGGGSLPEHVHRGFYSFAAYLQAAALQAEYLCIEADQSIPDQIEGASGDSHVEEARHPISPAELRAVIEAVVGLDPSDRTVTYVARRLLQHGIRDPRLLQTDVLTPDAVDTFKRAYGEKYWFPPFSDPTRRDVDLINALNFALIRRDRGEEVAVPGLQSVLERRLEAEVQYEIVVEGLDDVRRFTFGSAVAVGEVINLHGVQCEVIRSDPSTTARARLVCVELTVDVDAPTGQ